MKIFSLFKVNRFSFIWLIFLFILTVFANFIANDKPIYANYNGKIYFPVFLDILKDLGLYQWETELVYKDWKKLDLEQSIWTLIPFLPDQLDMENSPAQPPFSFLKIKNQKFYHYLGTDELGRDIASGLVYGTRYAIIVSFLATFLATIFGILIGSIAGYWGDYDFKISRYSLLVFLIIGSWAFFISFYSRYYRLTDSLSEDFNEFIIEILISTIFFITISFGFWKILSFLKNLHPYLEEQVSIPLDLMVSRIIEIKLSIPMLLLVIILTALAKPSLLLLIGIIAFGQWTTFARLIRAEILKIKRLEYTDAAKIQGFSSLKILTNHVIPNAMPPIWVSISFAIATAILVESALSFLGIGVNHISWGSLLKSGKSNLNAWWLIVFPGTMIFLTIFTLNQLNETLRKVFNPKKL